MKRIMKIASAAVLIVLMAASCRGEGEKTFEITESFSSIEVDGSETNIIVKPSPDGKIRVVVDEKNSVYYTAEVEKGVLKVERHKRAIDFNIFSLGEKKVEIMVEDKGYRNVSISVASGKIEIEEGVKAELYWENKTTRILMLHQLSTAPDDLTQEKYYLHVEPKQ